MIDGEKHNINAGNLKDCADITIPDDVVDGLITTATDAGNSADCVDDATGGLIASIDAGDSTDCADLSVSDNAADGLITTDIDAGN